MVLAFLLLNDILLMSASSVLVKIFLSVVNFNLIEFDFK